LKRQIDYVRGKGANLTRPDSRHREAPSNKAHQAAPIGRSFGGMLEAAKKIRGLKSQPVAIATKLIVMFVHIENPVRQYFGMIPVFVHS
jgi:hypothetical protein